MAADYSYDPNDYLLSTQRSLKAYVEDQLATLTSTQGAVEVINSFPVTDDWSLKSPLEKAIVHFEVDDDPDMVLGLGVPQVIETIGVGETTATVSEPALHELNFDVGIWTSAQSGGTTKRSQIRQALFGIFGPGGGRVAFNEATDGVVVVSYGGGADVTDRVNDLPIFRTTQITLVLSVFSRHVAPVNIVPLVTGFDQQQRLSIEGPDGSLEHLVTDEDPWT